MWDERCRFKLFHAWGGIQWRKCYFNHLTETVLVVFAGLMSFSNGYVLKNIFSEPWLCCSRRLSLRVLSEGKRGAVLAFVNETLRLFCEWGHLQFPSFTGCICCPEVAQNISFWALNGFASQQSRMFWKLFIFLRLFSLSPPAMLAASLQWILLVLNELVIEAG